MKQIFLSVFFQWSKTTHEKPPWGQKHKNKTKPKHSIKASQQLTSNQRQDAIKHHFDTPSTFQQNGRKYVDVICMWRSNERLIDEFTCRQQQRQSIDIPFDYNWLQCLINHISTFKTTEFIQNLWIRCCLIEEALQLVKLLQKQTWWHCKLSYLFEYIWGMTYISLSMLTKHSVFLYLVWRGIELTTSSNDSSINTQ